MYIIYIWYFPIEVSIYFVDVPLPPVDDTICWVPFSKEWEFFHGEKGMIFFHWFDGASYS